MPWIIVQFRISFEVNIAGLGRYSILKLKISIEKIPEGVKGKKRKTLKVT